MFKQFKVYMKEIEGRKGQELDLDEGVIHMLKQFKVYMKEIESRKVQSEVEKEETARAEGESKKESRRRSDWDISIRDLNLRLRTVTSGL